MTGGRARRTLSAIAPTVETWVGPYPRLRAGRLTVGHSGIDKWGSAQAARRRTIVVEGIGGRVVLTVPRTRRNPVPPRIAIGNLEALQLAGNLHCRERRNRRTLRPTRIRVVRPRIRRPTRRLRTRRRRRRSSATRRRRRRVLNNCRRPAIGLGVEKARVSKGAIRVVARDRHNATPRRARVLLEDPNPIPAHPVDDRNMPVAAPSTMPHEDVTCRWPSSITQRVLVEVGSRCIRENVTRIAIDPWAPTAGQDEAVDQFNALICNPSGGHTRAVERTTRKAVAVDVNPSTFEPCRPTDQYGSERRPAASSLSVHGDAALVARSDTRCSAQRKRATERRSHRA